MAYDAQSRSHIRGFRSVLLVYAPIGGFQSVTDALERLATTLGVHIEADAMVTRIQEDGVTILKGSKESFFPADLVVVNADLPYATKSLLSNRDTASSTEIPPGIFDWDDGFSFSSGVISFHWSVRKELNALNTHNVFMIANSRSQAEASWGILRDNHGDVRPDTPFNFYVHRASKTDPTAAPDGCDSIMVLVPCRTLVRDADYAKLPREESLHRYKSQFSEATIKEARKAVLARMSVLESLQNLEDLIIDEVVDTPATWAEQFHLAAGTPFALVSTNLRNFFSPMTWHPKGSSIWILTLGIIHLPLESWLFTTQSDTTKSRFYFSSKSIVLRCQHPTWEWSAVSLDRCKTGCREGCQSSERACGICFIRRWTIVLPQLREKYIPVS